MARAARNYQIAPGVQRFSRGKMYHKRGLFKKLSKPFPKQKKQTQKSDEFVVKKVGGDKNGKERRIPLKKSVWFFKSFQIVCYLFSQRLSWGEHLLPGPSVIQRSLDFEAQ